MKPLEGISRRVTFRSGIVVVAAMMNRLAYTRDVAQDGDWGSPISGAMARQAPKE